MIQLSSLHSILVDTTDFGSLEALYQAHKSRLLHHKKKLDQVNTSVQWFKFYRRYGAIKLFLHRGYLKYASNGAKARFFKVEHQHSYNQDYISNRNKMLEEIEQQSVIHDNTMYLTQYCQFRCSLGIVRNI